MLAAFLVAATAAPDSLDATLTPYLEKYQLPAVAAAVVKDGKVIAAGAVGNRRAGTKSPVTLDDKFHLGSDTKAMTALLAAMAVEEGKLKWTTTVGEAFPEFADKMDAGLKGVTLERLLSHTSGVPADNDAFMKLIEKSLSQDGNLDEIRRWMVGEWAPEKLAAKPGTAFAYANMNYVIAGAMIEKALGKTWEELITDRVFAPLELKTAGLGCQASLGRVDAPLGHTTENGKLKALLAGPDGDAPPALGPAGTAHMSVLDFARWAGWSAGRGKRGPNLVKPEMMAKLQTPVIETPEKKGAAGTPTRRGGYALGWGEIRPEWAPNPLVHHAGSNGKNLAGVWLDPARDLAVVVVMNVSGPKADEAMFAAASDLYKRYAK